MTLRSVFLPLMLAATFAACSTSAPVEIDPNRGPIGKADHIGGSCEGNCGGQANGCWCDDQCSFYGDCCQDKAATCDAPAACGGHTVGPPPTCDDGEFCNYEIGAICGFADAQGTCQDTPEACIEIYSPVCGCDNQTYGNSCVANSNGVSVQYLGVCKIFCGGFGAIQCPDDLTCVDDPDDNCDPANGGADCGGMCVAPTCQPLACDLACDETGFVQDANGCDTCACNPPTCQPVLCEMLCQNGFATNEDGCEICECAPQQCGGFGGIECPTGFTCEDDPSDNCTPPEGADCIGICVEEAGPVNSCADSCGGQSESGSCWCDDLCVQYGDCCSDIDNQCSEAERTPVSGTCIKNQGSCSTDADCTSGGCGGELCFNPSESNGISTCECGAPQPPVIEGCGCVEGQCTWYN